MNFTVTYYSAGHIECGIDGIEYYADGVDDAMFKRANKMPPGKALNYLKRAVVFKKMPEQTTERIKHGRISTKSLAARP